MDEPYDNGDPVTFCTECNHADIKHTSFEPDEWDEWANVLKCQECGQLCWNAQFVTLEYLI